MCGSTAGVMDAGLLLLIEMGQSYMLLSFLREETQGQSSPAKMHTEDASLWSTASSATPESSPILAHIGPRGQGATQAARFLDHAVVLPERHQQHENGKEDADDAVEAQVGLLRLMVEMGEIRSDVAGQISC